MFKLLALHYFASVILTDSDFETNHTKHQVSIAGITTIYPHMYSNIHKHHNKSNILHGHILQMLNAIPVYELLQ